MTSLDDETYEQILELRTLLRRFQHESELRARSAGITPMQHQLLLAIRGNPGQNPATIRDAAETLLLKHHSTVELIDRAETRGLITRSINPDDRRSTFLHLTAKGRRALETITKENLPEITALANMGKLSKLLEPNATH